ncbi:diacylglycerol/lipid kinase family protein [Pedobacter montanisoli]|uniref:Diacylglycerol kinase family lipid kinase n=1 Tax=Pedobacter montanisoli TaxID=2923277 RepID=A0ABS9ZTI0_9SPHI|nr:diacylglycerol kinase family protein [Pedobacter montanisoli]MCJ0741911.1 diacylglycerol kinase family lipid kinase [Pedobacter montanisoli]
MSLQKYNILFVINPISGGKKKDRIPALISKYLDKTKFNATYIFTEKEGHATEIAAEAECKNIAIVVAVGGDGTINEIASSLVNTKVSLGIIPFGSGNGLARFLGIPMTTKGAVKYLNLLNIQAIDSAQLNERHFFNMAGMGFDAHISAVFAGNKSRGLKSYVKLGLKEITSYKAQRYKLEIDGIFYERDAFAISIANSSQYGNNVYISPKSSLTDGWLDVCIIKPIPLFKLPVLAYEMIAAKTHNSSLVEIIRGKEIKIIRNKPDSVHLDGEPFQMEKHINIKIEPASLNIIVGKL